MKLIDYLIELEGRFEIRILPVEPEVLLPKKERDACEEWYFIIHVQDRFDGRICHGRCFISRENQDGDFIKAIKACINKLKVTIEEKE